MPILSQTPTVKVEGSKLSNDVLAELVGLRIELSVHRAGSATLRFNDANHRLIDATTFTVGHRFEVLFQTQENSLTSTFEGRITGLGVSQGDRGGPPVFEVVAHDASHRLAAASEFTTYLNQTAGEIVTAVARRHELKAEVVRPGAKMPYVVQAGNDHHFVGQLATMLGHEWFTTNDTLHFRPRPSSPTGPTLKYSTGLISFSAHYAGMATPTSVTVHAWDAQRQATTGGVVKDMTSGTEAMALGSNAPFVTESYANARKQFGRALSVASTSAFNGAEADALAASVGRRLVGSGLRAEGVTIGEPALRAGGSVTIDEVGTRLAGTYYLTDVVHAFGPNGYMETRFSSAGHHLEATDAGGAPGSEAHGAGLPGDLNGWGTRGLFIAVVTNNNDPEGLGRVKLQFPSLGPSMAESDWARVVVPGAGKQRGLDLRPEVDDEVVVGFDRGDPRAPFVLGGMFNGRAKPFDKGIVNDGETDLRVLASRKGHVIKLADGSSARHRYVEIALAGGKTSIMVGEEGITIEAASGTPLALKSGKASLTLTKSGDLVIEAANIKINAKQELKLQAGAGVALKAGTGAKIDGGTAFEAKGVSAKVEGSGMTAIKGGMVMIN